MTFNEKNSVLLTIVHDAGGRGLATLILLICYISSAICRYN